MTNDSLMMASAVAAGALLCYNRGQLNIALIAKGGGTGPMKPGNPAVDQIGSSADWETASEGAKSCGVA